MRTVIGLIALLMLSAQAVGQKQGIQGQVFWVAGNQMPSPDKKSLTPHQGVSREVHIYHAVHLPNVQKEGFFFKQVEGTLVTKILTDADGAFKVKLPEGNYSVFTMEKDGLFANLMDVNGCINCVHVEPKKFAWITITIDYEAAY
jgi:hypothetical protein